MTKYDETEKIGPVQISAIVAELSENPTTYMLDCDHAAECDWGMFGVSTNELAVQYANEHALFHVEHGTDSNAWRDELFNGSNGWVMTIPDQTMRYLHLLEFIVAEAKGPVIIDNTITKGALTICGIGVVPLVVTELGMKIKPGIPSPEQDWPTNAVWLYRGRPDGVPWPGSFANSGGPPSPEDASRDSASS
jgi:hypothetical protein